MRRLLEVQAAERVALGAEDRAGLNEASHEAVVGELLLAKRAGQVAAFVAATLHIDDDGVLQSRRREDHCSAPTGTSQRRSSSTRPAA